MQDRPTWSELLEAIRRFIERDIVPALDGPKQYHARVAANVLAIVRRELETESTHLVAEWKGLDDLLGPEPLPADRASVRRRLTERTEVLCARIRSGEADTGAWRAAVLTHVRQTVVDKLAVTKPEYLGAELACATASEAAARADPTLSD